MKRVEQNRRIDVALMIGTVDSGPVEGKVLRTADAIPNAAQAESESHTEMTQEIEQPLPLEHDREQHARWADGRHVEPHGDKRRHGPNGGDDDRRLAGNGKARRA
jgi:hypothetical protein